MLAEPHPQEAAALAGSARIPVILAELLVARGITASSEAFAFLNPEIAHLHNPLLMLGMKTAVERVELAIARKEIPACHYMMAAFGGMNVRVAGYARFGTKELSEHALKALEGRTACLLANHGMIATGASLDKAMWLAVELETIARQSAARCS